MKKRMFIIGAALGFALAVFLVFRYEATPAPEVDDLQAETKGQETVPPQNLPDTSQPQATQPPAQPQTNAAAMPPAPPQKIRLSEETLAPLRRAFTPPRFSEDPAIPRERQTLLSNRLLVSPETRAIPQAASGAQTPTPRDTTPFIVQFNVPVSDAARALLTDAGAIVRGFFPNNALLAELTPDALAALQDVAQVQAADEFLPSDKVQPFLASLLAAYPKETELRMTIQTLAPEDAGRIAIAVRKMGGEVEDVGENPRWGTIRAVLPLGAVSDLTALGMVQWVEESPERQRRNDKAAIPSHLNTTNAWNTWGLTGKGQVVGHADTGLDTGKLDTMHPDFQGRVRALIARARPGDASDLHNHGTHTAGSILGNGAASGGQYRGIAWEAELVHQSVANALHSFTGLPANLYPFFAESYSYGAFIHSDSWGASTYGVYDSDCRNTDLFVWDHPDHLTIFAASNDGTDAGNKDGVTDSDSIGSPATSKNVLTVGASESDRPSGSGGFSSYTWYSRWPSRFTVAPIRNDLISYSATTTPVYQQGMAAFSSRGPTDDNRIKPDVVAPGTDIISAKSSVGKVTLWGNLSGNSRYCFSGGTSMSTPLTAGCAALVRQYCVERAGIARPSAALLKAMLVGGARTLAPGQYGTNSTQEIPFTSPNNVEGWGQPDIEATVHPANRMIRLFDNIGPAGGTTNTFDVAVSVGDMPLDIALCWIDYPATAGVAITRVNDLDLLVVAPDGSLLYPNGGTERDTLNTVETVRVPVAQAGTYRVHVIGQSVPYSGGAAALYVRGAFEAPPIIVHTPMAAQIASLTPYALAFQIQALTPLTNDAARVYWRAESEMGASSETSWQEASVIWVGQAEYRAKIPVQSPGTTVHYYISAISGGHTVTLPADAPDSAFSFHINDAVELAVEGAPGRYGTVEPPYGSSVQIVNVPFAVSAPSPLPAVNGTRYFCAGWSGTGDIPVQGFTNAATLVISQPSTLTWNWGTEIALTNRYRIANNNTILSESVTWHQQDTLATTETAPELEFVNDVPYAFCGWSVDGVRWPNATSTSTNPASGIIMHVPRLAQGDYRPFWQDTDQNGLSDWWEQRYFGTVTAGIMPDDDPDNDGWSNLCEFYDNADPNDAASVPTPPEISLTPLAPFQTDRAPWTVTAVVTDNLSVEEVLLVWREAGESKWTYTPMEWTGEADTYAAELAPPSHGAKRVDYAVHAADIVGVYYPQHMAVSPTHSVIGYYDTPWLDVAPLSFERFDLSDTPTNIALTVANLAGPDLVWTAKLATAIAHFSPSNSAWAHSGQNDDWCVTTNRTWNGEPVWYCGNPVTRTHANACHAMLDTPPFTVGPDGGLFFRQWMRTEYDSGSHYWDGAVLRISTDNGATFTLIEPMSGYPSLITENPDSPFAPDHPCLSGDGTGWEPLLVDLSAYEGERVIVRFEFGSDLYTVEEGWYIADVTVFATGGTAPWLTPTGDWGSRLADTWETVCGATLNPAALAYDDEATAFIRIISNDPAANPLIPVTLRRGRHLFLSAQGPGTATADRTFLFRHENTATVTLRADTGCYLYSVLVNGVPQQGEYSYGTVVKTLTFSDLDADLTLSAWFSIKDHVLTIRSSQGTPFPIVGIYTNPYGTLIDAIMPFSELPFTGTYAQTARYRCAGWTLTGHTPAVGSATRAYFALTNDAMLTWDWHTEYRLTTQSGANGTVAPTDNWYEAGSTAVVTAYPAPYYHLDAWGGDTFESVANGVRLSAAMFLPRAVSASFAPNLTAVRGVPEYWLAQYGWTQDFESAAESDTDADGMPAWAEWRADTDPTDARSRLSLTALAPKADGWTLTWIGGQARTQEVRRAESPAGPWLPVHTNLPPTPATNTITIPGNGASGFFRVVVP